MTGLAIEIIPVNQWFPNTYCDFNQQLLGEYNYYESGFTEDNCFLKCREMEAGRGEDIYTPGDILCCDYEDYGDNTYSCNLFAGRSTKQQDSNAHPKEYFSSNIYIHENQWKPNMYCDYNQMRIQTKTSFDPDFGLWDCYDFCESVNNNKAEWYKVDYGENLCCDFEEFQDGSKSCSLYLGEEKQDQDLSIYPDESFQSFVLPHEVKFVKDQQCDDGNERIGNF